MNKRKSTGIPKKLAADLEKRDQIPLGEDAFIKFQSIRLAPGLSGNYRYLILQDGRLFYAANVREFPKDRSIIFNTAMPETPNRILTGDEIGQIRSLLNEVDFFNQQVYQLEPVRDGGLKIVTVRHGSKVHEVWYSNVHNPLTDYLQEIGPEEPRTLTPQEELDYSLGLLREQKELAKRLNLDSSKSEEEKTE